MWWSIIKEMTLHRERYGKIWNMENIVFAVIIFEYVVANSVANIIAVAANIVSAVVNIVCVMVVSL